MTGNTPTASAGDRWRLVPILGWIRSYDRRWLRGDLVAGVAVAALIVPKNLGYAGIAGIPLQNGLYAAAAGAILYAIFGTSRQISTGPSSGLAAVAASAVVVAGITGIQDVASFVALITLGSGALFLVLAVLKMGWIAQFLSRAVVTGFLFGAAIDVVIGELPKLTGTEVTGSNPLQELWSWLGTLGDAQLATVLVGGASLGGRLRIEGDRARRPRRPGPGRRRSRGVVAVRPRRPRRRPRWRGAQGAPDASSCLTLSCWRTIADHDRARGGGAGAHRVLADRRRRQDVRGQAPLSHRHQPGVGRPGHGQRRRRPVPGNAGLDEPVRELAERPHGRAHRPRLAHLRRDRPPHPARAGAAVLGPAQAGARRL